MYKRQDMLNYLNGMFAFAICDLDKRQVFVARDQMGIKPLHYIFDGSRLAFASEMKSLTGAGLSQKKIDQNALWQYLSFQCVPAPMTIYKDIRILPAAHYMPVSYTHLDVYKRQSFGDQMYLNNWPLIFDNVYEVQNKGAGVAPWNITQYKLIDRDQNQIILKYKKSEICKLVFFHFQGLNFIDGKIINLNIYNEMGPIDDELVNLLYDEYIREILDARVFLQKQYMQDVYKRQA